MTDLMAADDSAAKQGRSTGAVVAGALVRCARGTVENVVGGVLALVHAGRRRKVAPIENALLLQPAHVLALKIRRGEVTSEELVKAYIQRIGEVNGVLNAVVESRFPEALEEAKKADQLVQSNTLTQEELATKWPLLGIPFTAKEAVVIKGLSSTCGLVCRKGMKAEKDCEAVAMMRSCGAIPLAVTNTSEICMWWETYNKLHGLTNNPYDTTRTVGGSSGGEAALIASGGSLLGLGTDLGGSIRLPSFFTGIFGHKPSQGLVPHGGQYPPALTEISPYVVTGPMTRYCSDLRLTLRALIGKEQYTKLQLDSKVDLQTIKVYYMLDDGGHPAHTHVCPEIKDGMKKVVNLLSETGLTVKEVKLSNLKHGFMVWCTYLSKVKDQRIARLMTGDTKNDPAEPLHQELWKWVSGRSEHTFPIIFNACAQDHLAPILKKPLEFFFKRGDDMKKEMDELLKNDSVFLYPTFPTIAAHHGQMLVTPMNVGYNVVFNALGLPVTQCPLGVTTAGMPVGMQIVTSDGNDRLSIAIAEEIEAKLGGWVEPS